MIHRSRHDYIKLSFLYVLAVLATLCLVTISTPAATRITGIIEPTIIPDVPTIFSKDAFLDVAVRAKSFIVYDLITNEIIASKNESEVLPLASLTKIMTAVTARTHNKKETHITVTTNTIDGGLDLGLKNNQVWDLDELLKYTLVFSSNDGALSIAHGLGGLTSFIKQMNEDAKVVSPTLTFTNPAGLDVGDSFGGQGTALDVAKLLAHADKNFPELFDATTKQRAMVVASTGRLTGVPNTNQDINNMPEAVASKTGYTDSAGGNLAIIVDITVGHPVAIVVLGSTKEERFTDVEMLYKTLKKSIQN